MNRTPVNSSNLRSVGYTSNTRILEIEFNTGTVYEYYDVPENIYQQLMAASSHGKFFHAYIKNVYNYKQLR
jgi:non-ribosomal peptide synthetase component F